MAALRRFRRLSSAALRERLRNHLAEAREVAIRFRVGPLKMTSEEMSSSVSRSKVSTNVASPASRRSTGPLASK